MSMEIVTNFEAIKFIGTCNQSIGCTTTTHPGANLWLQRSLKLMRVRQSQAATTSILIALALKMYKPTSIFNNITYLCMQVWVGPRICQVVFGIHAMVILLS